MRKQLLVVLAFLVTASYADEGSSALYVREVGTSEYGGRVAIVVCVTNSTMTDITIPYEGVFSIFAMSLKNSAGEDAKLTALGAREEMLASLILGRRSRVIKPGTGFCMSIYLNMLYDMSLPDIYVLRVKTSYSLNDNGKHRTVSTPERTLKIDYREHRETTVRKEQDAPSD